MSAPKPPTPHAPKATHAPEITSLQNPTIKRLVKLRNRRARDAENAVLVEGARETARALAAGWQAREVYLCPGHYSPEASELAPRLCPTAWLSPDAFAKASARQHPDGVLSVFNRPEQPPLPTGEDALLAVLRGLEKPGNVGAVLRTADGVGAAGALVLGRGADPYSAGVIRASQGSVFHLPVWTLDEAEALAWLRTQGFRLVACTPDAPRTFWEADLTGRVALLLGTEHEGLPAEWREGEHAVAIPMQGEADSLNVSTAAAVVLYEALRQRLGR